MTGLYAGALAAAALAGAAPAIAKPPAAKPALTGMWLLNPSDFNRTLRPDLTPAAAAAAEATRRATNGQGVVLSDHAKRCLPIGMPRFMTNEFALEILESPGRVTLVSENSPLVRSVYLNRKTHPTDLEPSWNGHSIGHWDGATLVVDTANMNDRMSHVPRGPLPSGQAHIVERFHLEKGGKVLVNVTTFEDPVNLAKPFTVTTTYNRLPADAELWEYACEVDAAGWSERYANDPDAKLQPAKPAS